MAGEEKAGAVKSREELLARVRSLTAGIRERAAAAEEARTVPRETIDALLAAGGCDHIRRRRFPGGQRGSQ